MAYFRENFKSKKAAREALAETNGEGLPAYQPGPFGPDLSDGWHAFEGPHFPKPHRWYARCRVEGGRVVEMQK